MAKDDYLEKKRNGGSESFTRFHSISKPTNGWNGKMITLRKREMVDLKASLGSTRSQNLPVAEIDWMLRVSGFT